MHSRIPRRIAVPRIAVPRTRARTRVAFILAVGVVAASAALILTHGRDPSLPPELAVVAMLAAFVMALCFRQFAAISKDGISGKRDRRLVTAALMMAAAALLADARIVAGVAPHMFTRTLRQVTGPAANR